MPLVDYPFRNLVFEGGGVKGIAYCGALGVLDERGILSRIRRVGGASAGAINATLLALGCTVDEVREVLSRLDFNKFKDDDFGIIRDAKRLLRNFSWHKGYFFPRLDRETYRGKNEPSWQYVCRLGQAAWQPQSTPRRHQTEHPVERNLLP